MTQLCGIDSIRIGNFVLRASDLTLGEYLMLDNDGAFRTVGGGEPGQQNMTVGINLDGGKPSSIPIPTAIDCGGP